MKKLLCGLVLTLALLTGCNKGPHESYKVCVDWIVNDLGLETYTYTVEQIQHDEVEMKNEKIYCFDITIYSGDEEYRYCCFALFNREELLYVDCDRWEE